MNDIVKTISQIEPPWPYEAYSHVISLLSAEEGGGFMITFPRLPGCMSDGESEAEAIENGRDAFIAVVSALYDLGREIPAP